MAGRREAVAGLLLRLRTVGLTDHRLLSAFEAIPRQNFVPIIYLDDAYARGQMPIECGQSMSAVDHVAQVLSALEPEEGHRVLELGTGTGYQAALLSKLAHKVTSLERFRTLVDKAKTRLENLGISNVLVRLEDGREGDKAGGTYDRIIANCAFEEQPRHLIEQLTANGILIAPIGPADGVQIVKKMTKIGVRFETKDLFAIRGQPFGEGVSQAI